MKHFICICVLAVILMMTGCAESEVLMPQQPVSEEALSQTRATSFEENWETYDKYVFPDRQFVYMPWSKNAKGDFDIDLGKDIKKEDGWVMLGHTFNDNNQDVNGVYIMMLYNKKTGDLKICYDQPANNLGHSSGIWKIDFYRPQGWCNSLNEIALPATKKLNDGDGYCWISTVADRHHEGKFNKGWNIVVIPNLAYDPSSPTDQQINIGTDGFIETVSTQVLEGTGITDGVIITTGYKNPLLNLGKSLANHLGTDAETWATKNLKKNFVGKGIKGLIAGGVNLIANKLFGSFTRQTQTTQQVRLTTNLNLKGTIESITNTQTGLTPTSLPIGKDDTGVELGVWNLADNPTVYMHPVGVVYQLGNGLLSDENLYAFTNSGNFKTDLLINPQIKANVISSKVECEVITAQRMDKKYPVPLKSFSDYGSLGAYKNGNVARYVQNKENIFGDKNVSLYKHVNVNAGFWRIWNKYGKDPQKSVFKYIYAPKNMDLVRGGNFKIAADNVLVKVTVQLVTKFENKRDTTVETRTFVPKFEWDPSLMQTYGTNSMSLLQSHAAGDAVLQRIDNNVIENCRQ